MQSIFKKNNFRQRRLTLITVITVLLTSQSGLYGANNYNDYIKKGDRNEKIIKKLAYKYPLTPYKRNLAIDFSERWNKLKASYPGKNKTEKNNIFLAVKDEYAKSSELLKDIAIDLGNIYDLLYGDLSKNIYAARFEPKQKTRIMNKFQVATQENARALKAYRNTQYYFSAHLMDRAITLLIGIYHELGWEIPQHARDIIPE